MVSASAGVYQRASWASWAPWRAVSRAAIRAPLMAQARVAPHSNAGGGWKATCRAGGGGTIEIQSGRCRGSTTPKAATGWPGLPAGVAGAPASLQGPAQGLLGVGV
jgi:hypothetical protein